MKVNLAVNEAPPNGENNFIWKPDPNFLLVVCWHLPTILNHFQISYSFLLSIYKNHAIAILDDVIDQK